MRLDGNTFFALKIHSIKELILLFPIGDSLCLLHQPVGKSCLSVVNVGDNGKIARQLDGHNSLTFLDE